MWIEDSVTGNASGSYTFNRWKAEEYVSGNWDMVAEMLGDFGYSAENLGRWILGGDWETIDVLMRCWLLGQCIEDALERLDNQAESAEK